MKPISLDGMRFGKLVVVRHAGHIGDRRACLCECDCGIFATVRVECLRGGITKSCGCIRNLRVAALNKTHGKSGTSELKSWSHAKSRVTNQNDKKYPYYGGRGITMCDEWINSAETFLQDMGRKPSPKHSLGRIDVNGNYSRANCRWETTSQQARARTDNVIVDVKGVSMVLKDACLLLGLNYKIASAKMKNTGVSFLEFSNA